MINDSLELSAPEGFNSYTWNNGSLGKSIMVNSPGLYFVTYADDKGCFTSSSPIQVIKGCLDSLDNIILNPADSIVVCSAQDAVIECVTAASYQWSTGDVQVQTSIEISGWYTVTVTDFCNNVWHDSIFVDFRDIDLLVSGDTIAPDEQAVLVSNNDNTIWYDIANPLEAIDTGRIFQTPALSETTTYIALLEQLLSSTTGNVGEKNFDFSNLYSANTIDGALVFVVSQPITITSIKTWTDTPGRRRIIINVFGEESSVYAQDFILEEGNNTLALNTYLLPGTYKIRTDVAVNQQELGYRAPRLARTFMKTQYPYTLGNAIEIITSEQGDLYYYYFYDWAVEYDFLYCYATEEVTAIVDRTLSDSDVQDTWSLSPNPTSHMITWSSTTQASAHITLYTLSGQVVWTVECASGEHLDISHLAGGLYIAVIRSLGKTSYQKLVKYE